VPAGVGAREVFRCTGSDELRATRHRERLAGSPIDPTGSNATRIDFTRAHVSMFQSPRQYGREARAALLITTETLAKPVDQLNQHYKRCGRNPGKYPDTRRMVFASKTGSRDIALDRFLRIAV
jgi:hypothetical protein